jgi:D-alanyl-D-alanine carboxypeptidase
MTKKIIIISISLLSIIGFIFVLGGMISKRGNDTGSIFANIDREKKQIEENVRKYQPQKSNKTKEDTIEISAKSAILVDENTNKILYQKEPDLRLPPASITKIATISVALENLKKEDLIEISQKASEQEPNKIVMKAGEKMALSDLLYGLMMISANDAAYAIAEAVPGGYDHFLALINDKVKMLGLTNSYFKNPSGLDEEGHYSSAFDIATLTRYALLEHPEVIDYAGKKDDHSVYPTDHNESHWWSHISGMLYRYPGMTAAKTGYTEEAGSTFIGIAERNGRRIIVVFFGASDANGDVVKLLDFGFAN